MKVYYLGFYVDEYTDNRYTYLSATNKMSYIIKTIDGMCIDTIVVSSAWSNIGIVKGEYKKIGARTWLKTFLSFGAVNKLQRKVSRIASIVFSFLFLIANAKKGDCIIVYHSTLYLNMIKYLKRFLQCTFILEIEEIYADVSGNARLRRKEMEAFAYGDAFIFPTELLNSKINRQGLPSIIVHGSYCVDPLLGEKSCDGNVHVVYAGTLDPRKGGAAAAAAAAAFLPDDYIVHILGFGSDEDKNKLIKIIQQVNAGGKEKVIYHGVLKGEEYTKFIQSCHIGLSTQNPNASFNDTSFPSKILSYMANGLQVVSVRIPAIEKSKIDNAVVFYDKQDPQEIAKAIVSAHNQKINTIDVVKKLDSEFSGDLKKLLEDIANAKLD